MISSIRGSVLALGADNAVIEIGGVGLLVQISPSALRNLRIGGQVRLSTSLVVREDSLTLFGFHDDDERALFELLQTASGVGPRLAQAMLAIHPAGVLRMAIASDDFKTLELVPGIGRKGAQRICLELKDRMSTAISSPLAAQSGAQGLAPWRAQVQSALLGLGFSNRDAAEAIDSVLVELSEEEMSGVSISEVLRIALRSRDRG
ncbi:MAG TPA: Holliday junction branch migration protein RuvA [Candidatus Nanopelagicaceae bacterium]|nr:Holliday junction branch migration protein RuvA [Candidatus Nanopelagicaceae bacterium]